MPPPDTTKFVLGRSESQSSLDKVSQKLEGYDSFQIRGKSFMNHICVTAAFIGDEELTVDHSSRDKTNNSIVDLAYETNMFQCLNQMNTVFGREAEKAGKVVDFLRRSCKQTVGYANFPLVLEKSQAQSLSCIK